MYDIIYRNLDRQSRGFALLHQLLREEYDLIRVRQAEDVVALEFSIHELLRQLAVERQEARSLLGGGRVVDYAAMLDAAQGEPLLELRRIIDDYEQVCARQATRNCELSLALLDMSKELADFLHARLVPPARTAYSREGVYTHGSPEAMLISGRL
jgi:hypothetical protein